MKKIVILFILLISALTSIKAQSAIIGIVVDSLSGTPLAKATVMLLRDGRTIHFVRTDDRGRFSFDVQQHTGDMLQVTFMGYAKHRQPVDNDNTIRLTRQAFQLKEVKVQGPPVTMRRDTIVYDLTKFTTNRDNNLKDVLKKLPGVDVEKDGQIKYKGQAISRFTVEGLDLSKGQYNKLTDNIRAKDVKKAEVVEHDQPIKALRNRVFTDDIGMNIELKDSARDQLFVTLRPYLLADDPTHVGGDAVGMQIGKKRQMETTVQYDRSGRDLNNQFSLFYNAYDFAPTATMPQWHSAPSLQSPFDAERLRMNTSQAYSVDHLTKDKNDAENSFSASYSRNVIRQHTQNVSQYFLGGQSLTQTTEDRQMILRQDAFSIDYNHHINADSHYGDFVVNGDASRNDGITDYTGGLSQKITTPDMNLAAAINQTYTLGRNIIAWKSTADYHHSKGKFDLTSQSDSTSATANPYSDELVNNLWHTAHSLSWNRQYGRWHADNGLRFGVESLNVAHENNVLLQGTLSPTWYYKDDDWRISFDPGLTLKRFTHQGATLLLPHGSIFINRNYGNRSNWSFSINYNESTSAWNDIAVSHRQIDYRTWIEAPDFVPRSRTLLSLFEYNYKRPIYQFFSNFKIYGSRLWNTAAMDMVITDGKYSYTWIHHNSLSDNANASVYMSKGWSAIHLKTNLALSGNYSKGQQYSAGDVIDYRYLAYTLSPELIFAPSWMEIDYHGDFSFNRSKAGDDWTKTLANWTQRLTIISTIRNVDLSLSGVLYHNEIQDSPSANTLLADAKVTWRMKKVRFSVALRNLFNKKTYEETTYSGVGIFTNRYWLRPREFMAKVQFSL